MAYRLPPDEIMDRFSNEDMTYLVAYQNLYGPITPRRLDLVAGRLGMDVVGPHMKRGRHPRLEDHTFVWSRHAVRLTGDQMIDKLRTIHATFEYADDEPPRRQRKRRGLRDGDA
ncbi:hypothetical protein ACQEV4_42750 [Streptomyces shenzhenensis]|uniref:hypothetical protein n=1 Tax=Streptomyces shenzhenensis TaxID=943815 RepID=UPI003D8C2CA4